jgi:hypothetical protein
MVVGCCSRRWTRRYVVTQDGVENVGRYLGRSLVADQQFVLCGRHSRDIVRALGLEKVFVPDQAVRDGDVRWTRIERVVFAVIRPGRTPFTALCALLVTAAMLAVWVGGAIGDVVDDGCRCGRALPLLGLAVVTCPILIAEWRHWSRLLRGGDSACQVDDSARPG